VSVCRLCVCVVCVCCVCAVCVLCVCCVCAVCVLCACGGRVLGGVALWGAVHGHMAQQRCGPAAR
jgi:hypothetical protein